MPIYEYRCTDCDTHVEKMQKISDAPLTVCEKCGGKMEKKWSLSGFQFKGAGWYVTDYSNKGKPETKSAGSESGTKGGEATAAGSSSSSSSSSGGGESTTATTSAEKSSGGESTAAPSAASNSAKSDSSGSKKE